MRVQDKVIVITGSARGLGKAFASNLLSEGARVVVNDINEDLGEKTVDEFNALGYKSLFIRADVRNRDEVKSLMDTTVQRFGKIDVLINNAGIARGGLIHEMDTQSWDDVLGVNLTGVFNCSHYALKYMIPRKYGKIINISSRAAMGLVSNSEYSASKAGVNGLTRTMALELAPHNILVNAIAPAWTRTDLTQVFTDDFQKERISRIPLGRIGEPEDIAPLVLFLASDDSNFITGQIIHVDGGMSVGFSAP
jgi:3-oxoacyl-[acyl-carrier protein] reductase